MIVVKIRKQGGYAIITIPSDVLKLLNVDVSSMLELEVSKESFTAHPVRNRPKRDTLAELLKNVDVKEMKALNKQTRWARNGKSIGREIK